MGDERSVREKIDAGAYEPRGAYPEPVRKPPILSKRADQLTDEELVRVPALRVLWQDEQARYKDAVTRHQAETGRLLAEFAADLMRENGVDPATTFASAMYSLAWDRGHSAGLHEVASEFESLLPLWELYRDKR